WFGNLVTARSGPHHWLQESFATYFQMLFTKQIKGDDFYRFWMRENALAAFKSSATDLMGVGHSMAGSNRHYLKGAYVLDMLQYVVGNDMFKKAIQHYLNTYAFKNVETDDFMYAFHEATGHNLYWFFDEWIKRGGEPKFKVSFEEKTNNNQRKGTFLIQQVHEISALMPVFKMPAKLQIFYLDGSSDSTTLFIENQLEVVSFNLSENKSVAYVLFDPNSRILKQIEFNKPFGYLEQQALNARHFIDRYDAVKVLSEYNFEQKQKIFYSLESTEEFQAIRAEMAIQILREMNPKSFDLLKKLATDKDPKVAKAILSATPYIPNELLSTYESFLQAPS